MAEGLLEVNNIETYYGPIMAIRGISFGVPRGAIVTILGANGAGKTTILKTVSGVMEPQKGTVTFEGRALRGLDPDKVMRLGLSHVPEGREVFPLLTVRENLKMGAYTRTDAGAVAQDMQMVYDYFPVLAMRAEQRAGLLSGGEQQMLSISRALMARPKMMLLDEPSLGLSPKLVKDIFDIIVRINHEQGVTILLVEQNANMALHIADYGYVLDVGRIVMEDTCARLLEKDDIKEFYLASRTRASAARAAGRGRRCGDEKGAPEVSVAGTRTATRPDAPTWTVRGQGTLPTLFRQVVRERADQVAMREKSLGIWRSITWREYGERAKHVGLGLVALGLRPRDVVSIVADNCPG